MDTNPLLKEYDKLKIEAEKLDQNIRDATSDLRRLDERVKAKQRDLDKAQQEYDSLNQKMAEFERRKLDYQRNMEKIYFDIEREKEDWNKAA